VTPEEQDQAFKKAVKLAAGERAAIQKDTFAEVKRLLDLAGSEIDEKLKAQPSDYAAWYLPQVRKQIEQALRKLGGDAGLAAAAGQAKAWDAGLALTDKPFAAAQVDIAAVLPRLDTGQLLAMQSFLTGKIKDVSLDALNRINTQLALTMIGSQGVSDAITNIQEVMGGIARRRAQAIVRTEVGRAFSTASQLRSEQATKRIPALKKQWRRSGKIHSRRKHDLTDGQIRPVDKPFILGTGAVAADMEDAVGPQRIMYPHDPAAPPAETINCGCISLPYMDSWADDGLLAIPGKKPFSAEEIALNPLKQEIAEGPTLDEIRARMLKPEDSSLSIRHASEEPKPPAALDAPKVRRVLREVERRIAAEKVEVAVAIDRSGNLLGEVSGDAEQVRLPSGDLKDAVVTHTHLQIGSFSGTDIRAAMAHEMAEIRAVDPWYTYIMRPGPKGWDEALWTATVAPLYEQLEAETVGKFLDLMMADKATQDDFLEHAQHTIWKRISRAIGLRYTRRKR